MPTSIPCRTRRLADIKSAVAGHCAFAIKACLVLVVVILLALVLVAAEIRLLPPPNP